jgi:hypothetical protein
VSLRELMMAVAAALLLLAMVGIVGGGCAHNSPAPNRGVDFLGAPERA